MGNGHGPERRHEPRRGEGPDSPVFRLWVCAGFEASGRAERSRARRSGYSCFYRKCVSRLKPSAAAGRVALNQDF
jgi:hypothetical protein